MSAAASIKMNGRPGDSAMRGVLLEDEPMSAHSSWRAGGGAEHYYIPADIDDLSLFLSRLDDNEDVLWIGLGSNLLVRDGGLKGVVIAVAGVLNEMALQASGLRVGAGLACAKVARFSADNGLCGAEFLAGIPGTIGGALRMNAGAFGGETWNIVNSVETMNRRGSRQQRKASEFKTAYRYVNMRADEWFTAAELNLETDKEQKARSNIRKLLAQRAASQPLGEASCGSVFRNPEGDYAARLIESCGLKGRRIGGARISEKHANFIVNSGAATATDIEKLIHLIKKTVKVECDVELHTEVKIVGRHPGINQL